MGTDSNNIIVKHVNLQTQFLHLILKVALYLLSDLTTQYYLRVSGSQSVNMNNGNNSLILVILREKC